MKITTGCEIDSISLIPPIGGASQQVEITGHGWAKIECQPTQED